MTLNAHKELEEYFHKIVNATPKELTMFESSVEYIKNKWNEFFKTKYVFVEAPEQEENYWAFEMVTSEWIDECEEFHPKKETFIVEPNDTTWMDVIDKVADELEKHYGYNIKNQIYYSVQFPFNELDDVTGEPYAGYGRKVNDELFQQVLLAFPELYEPRALGPSKGVFE
jgi:hypothetical protein